MTGLKRLAPLWGAVLFIGALSILADRVAAADGRAVWSSLAAIDGSNLLLAFALAALGHLSLTWRDHLVFGRGQTPLLTPAAMLASLSRRLVARTAGTALVDPPGLDSRLYGAALPGDTLDRACRIHHIAQTVAAALVIAGAIVAAPEEMVGAAGATPGVRVIAVPALLVLVGYVLWRRSQPGPGEPPFVPASPLTLALPPATILILSLLDVVIAGNVLRLLLPDVIARVPVAAFIGMFAVAALAGRVSGVPAGLAIADAVFVLMLPLAHPDLKIGTVIVALLVFRAVYLVAPLAVLALLLAAWCRARPVSPAGRAALPVIVAALTLAGGIWLAWSSVCLAPPDGPAAVLMPVLGSLAGGGLVLIARPLARRVATAWQLASLLAVIGSGVALAGGEPGTTGFGLGLLALLIVARPAFHRPASLTCMALPPAAFLAPVMILGGVFVLESSCGRPPFASIASAGLVLVVAGAAILRRPVRPLPEKMVAADAATDLATWTLLPPWQRRRLANVPADGGRIALAVDRRIWIMPGDQPAAGSDRLQAAWQMCEAAERAGRCPVFFGVSEETCRSHVDLGLGWLEIGEEARVRLAEFSITGRPRLDLRHVCERLAHAGARLEVFTGENIREIRGGLGVIDDAWRHARPSRAATAARIDHLLMDAAAIAILRIDDRAVAGAPLWVAADHGELAAAAVRCLPDAPPGCLDYLLVELMAWGERQGYLFFNLGLTPLSVHAAAPTRPGYWSCPTVAYLHGEHFDHPAAVRIYKERFAPVWQRRYVTFNRGTPMAELLAATDQLFHPERRSHRHWRTIIGRR